MHSLEVPYGQDRKMEGGFALSTRLPTRKLLASLPPFHLYLRKTVDHYENPTNVGFPDKISKMLALDWWGLQVVVMQGNDRFK